MPKLGQRWAMGSKHKQKIHPINHKPSIRYLGPHTHLFAIKFKFVQCTLMFLDWCLHQQTVEIESLVNFA